MDFEQYGLEVCKFVRHATKTERSAICRELTDHLEDHQEALLAAGCSTQDAKRMSLEAMGDAEEIGRALNKQYPLRWLVLARLGIVLVLVLAVLLVFHSSLFWPFLCNLQARTDPARYFQSSETMLPLDRRWELPGGNILRLYGTDVQPVVGGGYRASVYTVVYHKNPFREVGYPNIDLSPEKPQPSDPPTLIRMSGASGYNNQGISQITYDLLLEQAYDPVWLYCNNYDTFFDLELPLPWEVIEP